MNNSIKIQFFYIDIYLYFAIFKSSKITEESNNGYNSNTQDRKEWKN
jgi:hypothetical protein